MVEPAVEMPAISPIPTCICSLAVEPTFPFYLQSYIKVRDEKQALEMALMKEKEIALQSQLNSLKLRINPHFMFNNFNNLLELIEEDTELAGKFLSNLSKVRCV